MKHSVLWVFLVFLPVGLHAQQSLTTQAPFHFNSDYSIFRQTDSTSRIEISLNIYPWLTTYRLSEQQYHGFVKIWTLIRDRSTSRILLSTASLVPLILQDTSQESFRTSFVTKVEYALSPGSYRLEIQAKDSLGNERKDTLSFDVDIPRIPTGTYISDVELCTKIAESKSQENPFYKNSYEVTPNPSLLFGASGAPVVFTYAELYNLDALNVYSISTNIFDRKGILVKSRSRQRSFGSRNIVDISSTNVTKLASGKYRLSVVLSDTMGKEIAKSEKQFYVYNPHIQAIGTISASAKSAEFSGMTADELTDEFKKTRYLASPDDLATFEKLTTTDAQRQFMAQYWTDIEEGKRGKTDITRAIYLRRVHAANERFRSLGKEGWFSDRGRIYLLFGEPDEIQRFPSSDNSKPYEIWFFYQIENGVQFVFLDRSGFGDYVLIHSTKRGELRDDQWEQKLQ